MASQDWMTKDFYGALGVKKTASAEEIKKAYNTYARKYHPDRNPGDKAAEEKFKAASEAYQVLSNDEDRKQYDALRQMAGGGARFSPGSNGGFEDIFSMFGGGPGGGSGNVRYTSTGGGAGFEDILSSMFGGGGSGAAGGGFGFGSRRRPTKGADVTASVSLPLRQAVDGATVTVGTGREQVTARIPAGVSDGQTIRIAGKGQPGSNGGEPGDILVKVSVEPHPVYELKGKDVYVNLPVTFDEAALGATVEVPTIHGTNVKVKIPAGSSTDKVMRVRGKGVTSGRGNAGDMYVRIKIVVPSKLSAESRKAVEAFRKSAQGTDPRKEFRTMAQL
ncbi:MAG: J domain-containing protein [Trueperella sp.]|nr:J domain-containing protein [Trueperella sp.]